MYSELILLEGKILLQQRHARFARICFTINGASSKHKQVLEEVGANNNCKMKAFYLC